MFPDNVVPYPQLEGSLSKAIELFNSYDAESQYILLTLIKAYLAGTSWAEMHEQQTRVLGTKSEPTG